MEALQVVVKSATRLTCTLWSSRREVGNSSHVHPLACNSASTELYHSGSETVLCPNNMNSEFSAHLSEHLFCAMARAACVLIQTRPPRENCSIFFAIIDTDDPAQHPTRAPCRPYAKYVGVFHNHARQFRYQRSARFSSHFRR